MKIKFDSYADINRLQQLCIFAQHDAAKITEMAEYHAGRAEQMKAENAEWFEMRKKLSDARPGEEFEV